MKKYTPEECTAIERYLLKCGCPVQSEHSLTKKPVGLIILQFPSALENTAFDLHNGNGSGYLMHVYFRNQRNHPMKIGGVQIKLPWDANVSLLPHASKYGLRYNCYDFPGECLTFERDAVLNHMLSGRRRLSPGAGVSGLVLAIGTEPLPAVLAEHGRTEIRFSALDDKGNWIEATFKICTDRSSTLARERREVERQMAGKVA